MSNNPTYKLRGYQVKAVNDLLAGLRKDETSLAVLPTGSGKSLVIAALATRLNRPVVVFQPTKEILQQNLQKMKAAGHTDIGIYSASMNRKQLGTVTFATIGSIRDNSYFKNFSCCIIDECHLVNPKAGKYAHFIAETGLPVMGVTATPYRMRSYRDMFSNKQITEARILTRTRPRVFTSISHITQVAALYKTGFLSPIVYETDETYDSYSIASNSTGMDFADTAVREYNTQHRVTSRAVGEITGHRGKHTLCFTYTVDEAEAIAKEVERTSDIICRVVSAKSKPAYREQLIDDFRNGKVQCVVNVGVLTTGFDFPGLDCIVLARPTKSVLLYYQMVGRGVRVCDGKPHCRVVDLCGNLQRFGDVQTFELVERGRRGTWRLRSDKGFLTGVDVTTGKDLEKRSRKKTTAKKDSGAKRTRPSIPVPPKVESLVVEECLKWLTKELGWVVNRHDAGAGDFGRGYATYGIVGAGDIIGVTPLGTHIEIECKHGRGGTWGSKQQEHAKKVLTNNGHYFIIHGLLELKAKLKQKGLI